MGWEVRIRASSRGAATEGADNTSLASGQDPCNSARRLVLFVSGCRYDGLKPLTRCCWNTGTRRRCGFWPKRSRQMASHEPLPSTRSGRTQSAWRGRTRASESWLEPHDQGLSIAVFEHYRGAGPLQGEETDQAGDGFQITWIGKSDFGRNRNGAYGQERAVRQRMLVRDLRQPCGVRGAEVGVLFGCYPILRQSQCDVKRRS